MMILRAPSFWILVVLSGLIAWDLTQRDAQTLLFLARKGVDLIHWMAFWR